MNKHHRAQWVSLLSVAALCLAAGVMLADGHDSASTASHFQTKGFDVGDPVTANAGAYHFELLLLDLGGPLPLRYVLDYRSDRSDEINITGMDGPFGSRLNRWLVRQQWFPGPVTVAVNLGGGETPVFTPAPERAGEWVLDAASPVRYQLLETGETYDDGYFYLLDPILEWVFIFEKAAIPGWCGSDTSCSSRLVAVVDRNGNTHTWTYTAADSFRPARVSDGLGRWLDFTYDGRKRLISVVDQAGRFVVFTPEAEAADCPTWNNRLQSVLRSVTDAHGQVTTFLYACDRGSFQLVGSLRRPAGNQPYTQTYAQQALNEVPWEWRVMSQTDAYGNVTALAYDPAVNRVTETRPDGEVVVYEHQYNDGIPKQLTDPEGKTAVFGQTVHEQIGSVTDRLGDTSLFAYHPETGQLTAHTDALGRTTTWTWEAREQTFSNPFSKVEATFTCYDLVRVDHADGTCETFSHDDRGNVLARIDRAGQTWVYTYNGRGQVVTETNPAGGAATYTYNADGTLATATDSDTGMTLYEYDLYKRPSRISYPDGSVVHLLYDLNDRLVSRTDENGGETLFAWDANGNLAKVTDPEGRETVYGYDLMDRLVKTTDRLGHAARLAYDTMGRLAETSDATGVKAAWGYDPQGWPASLTRAGKTWATAHDDEGVPVSRTTPLGRTASHVTDKLGLLAGYTDPEGNTTTLQRDAVNRVTAVTDPNELTTGYGWTDRGDLAEVTLPGDAAAAYTYDARGLLAELADLNGAVWSFAYTVMGRLLEREDPLGRTTLYGYDIRGRLDQVAWPGGGSLDVTLDGAGNVRRLAYAGGPDLNYFYDSENRLLTTEGVTLERDAEGRVVSTADGGTAFGATYDGAGRLASVTYDNGAFTVTYTYDVGENGTGLLTGVSDNLTGTAIAFTYDDDMRLRTMVLPNGEIITRTWDNADRLTRLQSGHHVDLALSYDPGGRITAVDLIAPLPPSEHLQSAPVGWTYDAASQNSSPGWTHDDQGRVTATPEHALAWDGASRLTGVDGVRLTYNGLGQARTRTAGGATDRFHYNQALALAPLVAEQDEGTGQMRRYYVWTPEGRLLYLIEVMTGHQVLFYHGDQVGSTLALTDAAGEVADAYAYDPYGRLLAHEGSSSQPFTFSGAWGVRQEGAGLYQMRARYYDAAAGRFLSPEPLWPQLLEPRALNPYQYAHGDPVRFIDPAGSSPELPLFHEQSIRDHVAAITSEVNSRLDEMVSNVVLAGDVRHDWNELQDELDKALWYAPAAIIAEMGMSDVVERELERKRNRVESKRKHYADINETINRQKRELKEFIIGKRLTIYKLLAQIAQWNDILRKLEENHQKSALYHLAEGRLSEAREALEAAKKAGSGIDQVNRYREDLLGILNY